MKKILKKIGIAVIGFAIAGSTLAWSTNDDPSKTATLLVTNKSLSNKDWSKNTTVDSSDKLSFNLHYYAWDEGGSNITTMLEDLDGKTFNSGDTETVTGKITASDLTTSNGSVTVKFDEKVKLDLYNVSWQKWPCASVGCETSLPSSAGDVLKKGLNIGSVPAKDNSYYAGNVVVTFKLTKVDTSVTSNDDGDVSTESATSVDEDSARLNGEVEDADLEKVWFAFSENDSTPSCSSSSQKENKDGGGEDEGDSFYTKVSGLDSDTKYYFKACGETSDGETVSGTTKTFTTDDDNNSSSNDDGDVSTESATSVDEDSARLNGEVEDADLEKVWFAFSENDSTPSCSSSSQKENKDGGGEDEGDSFYTKVSGLDSDTKYYFKACGETSDGETVSGTTKTFTTDDDNNSSSNDDGDVSTESATSVDEDSARLNGEVEDADLEKVWFAFSENDSTPSCSSSSQKENKDGGGEDEGDSFYTKVSGLDSDTKYYFKACGETSDGETVSGTTKTFTTDDDNNSSSNDDEDAVVVTRDPTNVGYSSAQFNGYVEVNDTEDPKVYFNYGSSLGMGNKTSKLDVSRNTYFQAIQGLVSGTRYYYQAVVVDNNNDVVDNGSVKVFTTKETAVATPTPTPRPSINVNPNINVTVTDINLSKEFVYNKEVSLNKTRGYGLSVIAKPGDTVYYKVRVANNTEEVIDSVTVTDLIPSGLELSSESNYNEEDKYITSRVRDLAPGKSKVFVTEMTVSDNVRDGDVINSAAEIIYEDKTVDTNSVRVDIEMNNQGASIFGSNSSFLPSTLIGWLGLLAFVLFIAFLVSKLFETNNSSRVTLAQLKALEVERKS